MDDLLSGTSTVEKTIQLCCQVSTILGEGCFKLRKWNSNSASLLSSIQSAEIARIFDPLGLLSSRSIRPKLILQKLWKLSLSWDESIQLDIHTEWCQFRKGLGTLNNLSIPRHVLPIRYKYLELHGLADGSQEAYGACVYVRDILEENKVVNLLCSKSSVAPMKCLTNPRLEICGVLKLARLMHKVSQSITIPFERIFLWTDTTKVLNLLLIKLSQRECFAGETNSLSINKLIEKSSKLKRLNPFLDDNGLIRVGGRLENSVFPYMKKHPYVISSKHHFSITLFRFEH